MITAKKFILKRLYSGVPKDTDVDIVEEELQPIKDGEFLTEAVYISVDPYMRTFPPNIGADLEGDQVAKIIESKSKEYPVGKYVVASFGWRTHTIAKEIPLPGGILTDFENLPLSLALGMLGMPGNTAYLGFLTICKPKDGETVVVSGAGGAVGSHVGQIAKIMGCKVIGILGDDLKGKYITEELGFDHYINYKRANVKNELEKLAPNGIDCYFDNVSGEISSTVISLMNERGRVCVCGAISEYNYDPHNYPKVSPILGTILIKQLYVEGFSVYGFTDRWNEAKEQNWKWIKQGKLKYKETITHGFDNTFTAFLDLFQGKNYGKAIVKV
ncbi:hypothetical protein RI129_002341 [Pyrocoelia pectoralis]|uniref:Prostaglandin reductase 1 n=1 Tax=Pyrocoelia pectoralis TaxID=417401 RepID=A0AAN7VPE5_9COLE